MRWINHLHLCIITISLIRMLYGEKITRINAITSQSNAICSGETIFLTLRTKFGSGARNFVPPPTKTDFLVCS